MAGNKGLALHGWRLDGHVQRHQNPSLLAGVRVEPGPALRTSSRLGTAGAGGRGLRQGSAQEDQPYPNPPPGLLGERHAPVVLTGGPSGLPCRPSSGLLITGNCHLGKSGLRDYGLTVST